MTVDESSASPSVLTVGYGGDTLDRLLERMKAAGVTHVADVRSWPYSKARPEFNGPDLQAALRTETIGYVFLGHLLGGRPDDSDCYSSDGRVDYEIVRTKPWFHEGLERVSDGVGRAYRVCLLCSEGRPETCHRTKLVAMALRERLGIDVEHIDVDGTIVSHSEIERRLNAGQQTLGFIDSRSQSAGAYDSQGRKR